MKLRNLKLSLGIFVLLAYMSIGIFGLFQWNHTAEMPMENCPYTQNGYAICANTLDHIAKWQQFSSAIFPTLLLLSALALGMILFFLNQEKYFGQDQNFYRWKYYLNNKKPYSPEEGMVKWLSLLENSPSFLTRT